MCAAQAAALGHLFFKPQDSIYSAAQAFMGRQRQQQHHGSTIGRSSMGGWGSGADAMHADFSGGDDGGECYGGDDGDGGGNGGYGDWGGSDGLGMDATGSGGGVWGADGGLHDMEDVDEEGYELLQAPRRFEAMGVNYSRSAKQVGGGEVYKGWALQGTGWK